MCAMLKTNMLYIKSELICIYINILDYEFIYNLYNIEDSTYLVFEINI